ncbi:lariat debranching enzyme [Vanessa atalanta]|uniref:lariat debranching enzyme n=1 Tax=Vanessa atalanta TaxID=42275 RepID=UPI001FCD6115|nr:lariat debranching enzyme [Vanessa atalanta]XP_047534940.1 lariat debranching enzyme [Vanessa atalanta]
MKIAVEGCAHGELDKIYECVETLQERENIKIDLLICCGDFQSVRNNDDLRAMAVPEKYQNICTFYKYYSGEKMAPVLTIFIGGNHEASNYLQELPYGGWVAPNIYYLGRAGVVRFGNLRIGGLSGIYKGHDYLQGLWECPPYTQSSLRSVYHIRALDVYRLSQIREKVHVMLSHDWPRGITSYGDKNNLLRRKPFLREDIESNQLGSPPAEKLLNTLKPQYWFAAHLHCQFAALVKHENDEETKFLALDKCLPKRRHLQILDLPSDYDGDKLLKYDVEWLAILKNTNHLLSVKNINCHMPGPGGNERYDFTPTFDEKQAIEKTFEKLTISNDMFVKTAPIYNPSTPKRIPTEPINNPQTLYLCENLGIDDPIQVVMARSGRSMKTIVADSNDVEVEVSPIKCAKLTLPAPVTPSENNSQEISQENSVFTPENSFLSESGNNTSDCTTPPSATKKIFKRRNLALYTPEENEQVSETSKSPMDSGSPRSSKLPCRYNEL